MRGTGQGLQDRKTSLGDADSERAGQFSGSSAVRDVWNASADGQPSVRSDDVAAVAVLLSLQVAAAHVATS